jgi:hypothetical protein
MGAGSFDSAATGDRNHLSRGGTDIDPDDPLAGGSGADREDDPGRYSRKIKVCLVVGKGARGKQEAL